MKRSFGRRPSSRQTLLIVDDDTDMASALRRLFRPDNYHILTANTAAVGFELLARHDVHVVISGQRMVDGSGTEFLNRVKDIYPNTIRVMLSGYTNLESVIAAISRGAIYRFFTKPWDDDVLRQDIREVFEHHWLLRDTKPKGTPERLPPTIDVWLLIYCNTWCQNPRARNAGVADKRHSNSVRSNGRFVTHCGPSRPSFQFRVAGTGCERVAILKRECPANFKCAVVARLIRMCAGEYGNH